MEESEFSSLNIVRGLNMSSRQYSDSLRVGILLALTGGFLDPYIYKSEAMYCNCCTSKYGYVLGINFMEDNFRGVV